jgi:hypothetical protein
MTPVAGGALAALGALTLAQYLGHLSYFLNATALLMRDILLLRLVAIVAAACNLSFAWFNGPEPNWIPVFWQAVFIAINTVWSVKLVLERRTASFTEQERELYQTVFRSFSPGEFMKLMRLAEWRIAAEGEVLARAGAPLQEVLLIYNGEVAVRRPDGRQVALRDGAFVGEMSFIRGGEATADVAATTATRLLAWKKPALRALLARNPAMRSTMHAVLAEDLTAKLTRA